MSAVLAPTSAPDVSPERMAAAGLRAFIRIAEAWGLTVEEQLRLLGQPPRSTFFAWRKVWPGRDIVPRPQISCGMFSSGSPKTGRRYFSLAMSRAWPRNFPID